MSTKSKKRSVKPARKLVPLQEWEDCQGPMMGDSSSLVARMPFDRKAVYARPGMVCSPSGSMGRYAIIEVMTPEICIVRFESGRPEAYYWGEIELAAVRPHPSYIAGKGGRR